MQKFTRTLVTTACAAGFVTGIAALLVTSTQKPADAFPAFTDKEGKPCGYCHVKAAGSGPRNYRGKYYKQNALTFAKFDDKAEAEKAGEPVGPDPDPEQKPKSWTAPEAAATPATPATPATEAPAAPEKKGPTVAAAKAKVTATSAAYKKAPKNAAAKKAYAAALADLGHATMLDQSIPPAKRYPEALRLTRQALALDPANKVAAEDKKAIEDAYKSMGRPVPQK